MTDTTPQTTKNHGRNGHGPHIPCNPELVEQRIEAFEKTKIPAPPSLDEKEKLAWIVDSALLLRHLIRYVYAQGKVEVEQRTNWDVPDYLSTWCSASDEDHRRKPGKEPPRGGTQGWMDTLAPDLRPDGSCAYYLEDLYCAARRAVDLLLPNGGCVDSPKDAEEERRKREKGSSIES